MSEDVTTGTIDTDIPARLDRLPWARFHWLVVFGLGTAWILDGLEVTLVGSVSGRMTKPGTGISITGSQIGTAGACYVAGACIGAWIFGQLTDRYGRKRLFLITLGVYIAATVATGFSFTPLYFYLARFFTGFGIGGEYAAINSAIDELIPARVRGRVDLIINGSYWIGSIMGAALAIFFLDQAFFPTSIGWRLGWFVGAGLAVAVMLVRRNVPESPRWLFIHGREEQAEEVVSGIEERTVDESGQDLPEPEGTIKVRQRESIPFREIARVAVKVYPKRSVLALALFVGQAFLYNGIVFNIGGLFTTFFGASSGLIPIFVILYAAGNFLGPVLLGRLFDTVGRKPMIAFTYLGSCVVAGAMTVLFVNGSLSTWTFEGFLMAIFFLASAGASSAYLTVSEIFPMETRALAIAFYYGIGTAAGGIVGSLVFGNFISTGSRSTVAIAFYIGIGLMAMGGIAELLFGVRAEQQQLEDIAKPLTAEGAEGEQDGSADGAAGGQDQQRGGSTADDENQPDADPEHREALRCRRSAFEERARAAEHRAAIHEHEADGAGEEQRKRIEIEAALAEVCELRAQAMDERAAAHDARAAANRAESETESDAATERASAAAARAESFEHRARAITCEREEESAREHELAAAQDERARAAEQRALAAEARGEVKETSEARALQHEEWALMHERRAESHRLRAAGDEAAAERAGGEADSHQQRALAAEERLHAAEQRAMEEGVDEEERRSTDGAERQAAQAERARAARDREAQIQQRIERRRRGERTGLTRFRPGPSSSFGFYSPGMGTVGTASSARRDWAERDLDREVDAVARALAEHGAMDRRELAREVGARYWGPGRLNDALHEALAEQRIRRVSRSTFAAVGGEKSDDRNSG